MKGDETYDEHIARLLQDPGFAAEWAIQAPLSNFSLNVWSLREAKGLTQQQLADAAKMKQPRVAEIERGDANPTLLTVGRIAFALGVSADRLLTEPDPALLASIRATAERGALPEGEQEKPAQRRKTA